MGVKQISDIVTSDYSHSISKRNLVTKSLVTKSLENRSFFEKTKRNRKNYSSNLAKNRAVYLAQKLNNPSRLMFYLKCSWNLTDAYLDKLLKIALTKNDPIKYFSASASREMQKNN
jgi:hypothetical protein